MTIVEALRVCKERGAKVRPLAWRRTNEDCHVAAVGAGAQVMFVERGNRQEMPHRLNLQFEAELLGEWEEVP
jgi:hypothetical protein